MDPFRHDCALCTDLYELTMAAAYFARGMHERRAAFEMFVRNLPERRSFLLCAGLEQAVSYLRDLRFTGEQLDYLRSLAAFRDQPEEFFEFLRDLSFTGTLWAIPEGTPVFADEPLLRVEGPLVQAQIVETFLLSMVNYQTLVATKAARVVEAARLDGGNRIVVDFGTRRAHGPHAAVLAARASFIGGCQGTSNVEAGFRMGIPVSGTQAHSFIMAFDDEQEAFQAYYDCFQDQTILLIDTYDSVEGARRAARVAPRMRGVRIDSGDMAELSKRVRRLLDEAGRRDALIFASGDLDEYAIADLVRRGAPVDGFGVGTRLVTGQDDAYLGGVYKLVAVEEDGRWVPRLKLSPEKATYPGRKQVQRFFDPADGRMLRDVICCADEELRDGARPLLEPVLRDGAPVTQLPALAQTQENAAAKIATLPEDCRRIEDPAPYPVEISPLLRERFEKLSERKKRNGP